ncbi:Rtf2 RING-finger-domain-containing protein [Coniochaeta sp. 2T2.1]|nr:Rtf2 RING-finger-domain-containing protein [Coniochaeta sp. 2T2.1]
MGNDGGSIPTRRELVKSAARTPTVSEMKATALESLAHAWSHDPLTSDALDMDNVVSDWRGRLYNYETVLKALMPGDSDDHNDKDKDTAPPSLVHTNGRWEELTFGSTGIKSLRDVVKLKFKRYKPAGGGGEKEIWACPMTLKELGPGTKAVYVVPCGHVFSEVAMKTIQEDVCPECSEKFESGDIVPILPIDRAEVERLTRRIEALREKGLTHSLKKDKSLGKKKRKAEDGVEGEKGRKKKGEEKKARKDDISERLSNINNPMTASLTAKVLAEQDEHNKRRKLAGAAR